MPESTTKTERGSKTTTAAVVHRACDGSGEYWYDVEDEAGRERETMRPCSCGGRDYGEVDVPACAWCGRALTGAAREVDALLAADGLTCRPDEDTCDGACEREEDGR